MGDNLIIVNVDLAETRVAIIENGLIAELSVERARERSLVGNVYRGHVVRVLPGMQAAFVDIGLERNAFLPVGDVVLFGEAAEGNDEEEDDDDEDDDEVDGRMRRVSRRTPIRDVLKVGEAVVVQVAKDPISTKGCRLTSHVSLPGRHLVYMPTSERGGISRRIESAAERKRLGGILAGIRPPQGALIARTAAEGATEEALAADAAFLFETWQDILRHQAERRKPGLVMEELALPLRAARDHLRGDVHRLHIDDAGWMDQIRAYIGRLAPDRLGGLKLYQGEEPIFDAFGIEDEIRRALARRVELPSGGYLIIDQAEALTAIDVNTGKFVGKGNKDHEETILKTNLEAVDEIAYQLRFRNIGGLIVCDLIDMDRPTSRRKVMARLKEVMGADRARTNVEKMSKLGLVEMTRERTRESLGRTLHEACGYCDGTGHTLSRVTVAGEVTREIRRRHRDLGAAAIEVRLNPRVAEVFKGEGAAIVKKLARMIGKEIHLSPDAQAHLEKFEVRARRTTTSREKAK